MRTDRHVEANSRFSQFLEQAYTHITFGIIINCYGLGPLTLVTLNLQEDLNLSIFVLVFSDNGLYSQGNGSQQWETNHIRNASKCILYNGQGLHISL